jgi:multiple sugar transport system ATP-binding protein
MGTIQLDRVEKWFGDLQIIKGVDLDIGDGEFVIFVGPSGCGKSTLLRLVAGLEETSAGTIRIDGQDVTDLPPGERRLAMVFQSYALYPHMSVRDNMSFGLRMAGMPKAEIDARVAEAARILKLDVLLDRRPRALSGGQRQRVAIGRAIVREPKAFLFDEPLSNLDAALRVEMRFEIARLHNDLGATMIYVTHDQVEAMTLADKIVVLNAGRVEQVGSPLELYERPANLFVAQFIGSPKMNVVPCEPDGGALVRLPGQGAVPAPHGAQQGRPARLGVRPEHIHVVPPGEGHATGRVEVAEHLGADTFLYVNADALGLITVRTHGTDGHRSGEPVGLAFEAGRVHLFDEAGRALGAA